jgi:hypothetical protein
MSDGFEGVRQLGQAVNELIALPFQLVAKAWRGWRYWRSVPLVQKSHFRAGAGAFVIVALALYAIDRGGFSAMSGIELYGIAGLGGFALLWLAVGVIGSRGAPRFDPMSFFWWSVLVLGAIALIVIKGVLP